MGGLFENTLGMYPQACFGYADTTCIACVDADNDDFCDDDGLQVIRIARWNLS